MSTLITRLTNTGTFLTNGVFDEVSIAGGSLSFNGINQFLTVPASTNLNIGGGSNFTIEAWIYLTATPQNPAVGIVVQDDGSSSGQCFQFRIDSSTNYLDFIYFTSSSRGSAVSVKSTTAVSINSWTHVAVTLSGTSLKLYINGILVGSGTVSGTIYSASITTGIGSYNYYFYPLYFPGYITNVRILKGTALYTGSSFTPPTQPLTAITNTQLLLDVASPAAYITDSSTNNFTVTNNNSVTYNSQTPVPITTPAERYSTAGYSVSGILDEVTNTGSTPQKRITNTGNCFISGIFDEVTGIS